MSIHFRHLIAVELQQIILIFDKMRFQYIVLNHAAIYIGEYHDHMLFEIR
jgi:hypothetical protein